MVYKFDPAYWNGTTFHLDKTWEMAAGWMQFLGDNIPAFYFPKSLTFDGARAKLPDVFHTARSLIVFSERARAVMEQWAPGQVEFIPVVCQAQPRTASTLNFASAYYFTNVLGRAQRLQWLEMPTRKFPPLPDGTEDIGLVHKLAEWQVRERAPAEPMIWRDVPWRDGNKRYSGSNEILIDDVLWRELDANFPNQLNALRIGGD